MPIITIICKNCNKSFETKQRPQKQAIFCNRKCYSEYGRPDLRKSELDINCEWCGGIFHAPKVTAKRRFCSKKCRGAWQSSLPYEDWKKKLSDNKENRPRGKENGMWGKSPPHGNWKLYKTKDGRELKLRSSWELAVAKYLDQTDTPFEFENKRFKFEDCTYLPDFYLPEEGAYWEVKGWMSPRSKKQINAFRREQPETPLVVIGEESIGFFADATNTKIAK